MKRTFAVLKPHTNEWLADNEAQWTEDFLQAANFFDAELAQDIGARECPSGTPFMVVDITTPNTLTS